MKNEETITGWMARDKNRALYLYCPGKPTRAAKAFYGDVEGQVMYFGKQLLPFVTWGNSPVKVKMTIEEVEESNH